MKSGSEQEIIHRMQQDMLWCEELLAVRWDSPESAAGGCLQHAIESRRMVASAASDAGQHELVQELCAPLYDVSETSGWEKVEAEARYQHASLVCFYAKYRSRERSQTEGTAREQEVNELLEVALPYVDRVCRDIADDSVRLSTLKSVAYAWVIASIRDLDQERVYRLMQEILELVRSQPDQLLPRKALFVAIDALIQPHEELSNAGEIKAILWHQLASVEECQEERSWLVGAVGVVAKLADKVYPEDEDLYLTELERLQAAWNRECLRDGNVRYASVNSFGLLGKYLSKHSGILVSEELQSFITNLLKTTDRIGLSVLAAQRVAFNAIRNHAPEAFVASLIDQYLEPFKPGERLDSPVDYASGLSALCHTGNRLDKERLGEVWDLIESSPDDLRLAWFEELSRFKLEKLPESIVTFHLDRLLNFQLEGVWEPSSPDYEAWSKAFLATLACARAVSDGPIAKNVLNSEGLAASDPALWAYALAIVAPGRGHGQTETISGWVDDLARMASQKIFTAKDAEPWMVASCTLVGELLANGNKRAAEELIGVYEATLIGLGTSEDNQMNEEFFAKNDQRLAKMLYQAWLPSREDEKGDDCEPALRLFDKLNVIEMRSGGAARREMRLVYDWLQRHGISKHPRYEHVHGVIHQWDAPKEKAKVNFIVASEPGTNEVRQVFAEELGQTPTIGQTEQTSLWSQVTDEQQKGAFLEQVTPIDGKYRTAITSTSLAFCSLPWYETVSLIRVQDRHWLNPRMAVYYLTDQNSLYRLNGTSPPIHEVNQKAPIELTEQNVLGYLRFFCFFVRGDEGPFYILENGSDDALVAASCRGPVAEHTTSLSVIDRFAEPARYLGKDKDGNFLCEAVIFYSSALFRANFLVKPGGMLEMADDTPLAGDLSFRLDQPIA